MIFSYKTIHGARKSPFYILTYDDISFLKNEIIRIGADISIFKFNDPRFRGTGYSDSLDVVILKGNVLPDLTSGTTHPRDVMSPCAVIAHEYYGHRFYRNSPLPNDYWQDEYRASRNAAEITPNLTDEERQHLVMDALERKREAGINPVLDEFEKKILYGKFLLSRNDFIPSSIFVNKTKPNIDNNERK